MRAYKYLLVIYGTEFFRIFENQTLELPKFRPT